MPARRKPETSSAAQFEITPDPAELLADYPPADEPAEAEPEAEPEAESEAEPEAVAEPELTPEQRRIAELEARLAELQVASLSAHLADDPRAKPAEDGPAETGEPIVIHVVGNGFTAWGKTWYLGQQIELRRGDPTYQETCDRTGASWLDMDENSQIDKYGEVMFRAGPWRGKRYADAKGLGLQHQLLDSDGRSIAAPTPAELAAADKAEQRRRATAPRLPTT